MKLVLLTFISTLLLSNSLFAAKTCSAGYVANGDFMNKSTCNLKLKIDSVNGKTKDKACSYGMYGYYYCKIIDSTKTFKKVKSNNNK